MINKISIGDSSDFLTLLNCAKLSSCWQFDVAIELSLALLSHLNSPPASPLGESVKAALSGLYLEDNFNFFLN